MVGPNSFQARWMLVTWGVSFLRPLREWGSEFARRDAEALRGEADLLVTCSLIMKVSANSFMALMVAGYGKRGLGNCCRPAAATQATRKKMSGKRFLMGVAVRTSR